MDVLFFKIYSDNAFFKVNLAVTKTRVSAFNYGIVSEMWESDNSIAVFTF